MTCYLKHSLEGDLVLPALQVYSGSPCAGTIPRFRTNLPGPSGVRVIARVRISLSYAIPSAGRVQISGAPTEHQKVFFFKPLQLGNEGRHNKILGLKIILLQQNHNFVIENFVIKVVIRKLSCCKKGDF